jgi:molecular chaperone GrpE (heat shock protein)
MNSSNKSNAMAGVLRDFLPAYDTMNELKVKYANDEFGSKYSGLSIGPTFEKMGVKEFSVAGGGPVDLIRMKVVGSEYSEAAKDTVVAQVASGIELEGNVIRAAECITSLGSQDEANNASGNDETGVEESSGVE